MIEMSAAALFFVTIVFASLSEAYHEMTLYHSFYHVHAKSSYLLCNAKVPTLSVPAKLKTTAHLIYKKLYRNILN